MERMPEIEIPTEAEITFNSKGIISVEKKAVKRIPLSPNLAEFLFLLLGTTAFDAVENLKSNTGKA